MLGMRGGGGIASSERVRNCSHVMGHYVNQQCQMHLGSSKAMCVKFVNILRVSYRFNLNKRTKSFGTNLEEYFV